MILVSIHIHNMNKFENWYFLALTLKQHEADDVLYLWK